MTVKVTQPSINLREKISELDYDRIPYEKMPAGSIIGVQQTRFDTPLSIDHSSYSYYNFDALNISVTPKSASSKFLCFAEVVGGEGDNPNGGPTFSYAIGNSRYYGPHDTSNHTYAWTLNVPAFITIDDTINSAFSTSANNWVYLSKHYSGEILFEPNTTSELTFCLGYYGNDTFFVNRNSYGQGYGSGWTTLTVMEIAG
jgi:hypothetical protein